MTFPDHETKEDPSSCYLERLVDNAVSSLVRYGPCEHSDLVSWFTERCPGIETQTAYWAFEDYCKKKRSEAE